MPYKKQRTGGKKVCYFTKNNIKYIDYKDVELLKKFISPNGKIIPRRVTGIDIIGVQHTGVQSIQLLADA